MNLSEWQQYTFQQREKLLADVASAVKNGEMPLRQYTFIHRQAKLTDAERDLVYQWARRERRKLRAESQSPVLQNMNTHDGIQPAGASEAVH
jgi:hypothetical protein